MLEQVSKALQKTQSPLPTAHGHVILLLVFAFVLSGWLLYHGVNHQVQAYDANLSGQIAVEITQTK